MKLKKISTLFAAGLLLLQFAACARQSPESGESNAAPTAAVSQTPEITDSSPPISPEEQESEGFGGQDADGITDPAQNTSVTFPVVITDSLGNEVAISSANHVISLYGSFTEAYLLAGGTVIGTTQDAIEERGMTFSDEVTMIGTVKEPNLELLITLQPDFVILSADIANQAELDRTLSGMGIPHAYFRVDTFEDYCTMMSELVKLTGRTDLYAKNVTEVAERIDAFLTSIPEGNNPSVLLIRAFSTGAKAKTTDNFTGMMLEEFHTYNIASAHESLLEDLSIETIIAEDPDFIFVTTMGSETAALENLAEQIESNPAWSTLSAVQNDRYIVLPKDLFHYKPNARWDEAYEYLARILYPEIFN